MACVDPQIAHDSTSTFLEIHHNDYYRASFESFDDVGGRWFHERAAADLVCDRCRNPLLDFLA